MDKQLILTLLETGREQLEATFKAVPDDKLQWKPLDNGRAALDLFAETAQTAGMIAQVAQSRGEVKPSPERFAQMRTERADWTRDVAIERFDQHYNELVAAIESLSEEELLQSVTMPMRGGVTRPLAAWILMAYRSFVSRFAQINYIQTLYGDFDAH